MELESVKSNVTVDSKNSKIETIRQDALPDSQSGKPQHPYTNEDTRQIIDKILSIAKEIGWLCERKSPLESDSAQPLAK